MYILNTSFMVEQSAHDKWYKLLTEKFIPLVREAGFDGIVFSRVLSAESEGHHTYSLQVEIDDMTRYKEFTDDIFPQYTEIAMPFFGEEVLYFTTLMKKIEL